MEYTFAHINVLGQGIQVSRTVWTNLPLAKIRKRMQQRYPDAKVQVTKGHGPAVKGKTTAQIIEEYDPETHTMICSDGTTYPATFDILILD